MTSTGISARRTLVVGAARPLGVELVRQCLVRGDRVYAAARNPARVPALSDLRDEFPALALLALDPADAASVADAIPALDKLTESIDLLVLAPAEPGANDRLSDAERDDAWELTSATGLLERIRRHAVAPTLLVRALLPSLIAGDGARILAVSSWLGSLAGKTQGGDYASCASFAAYNMMLRTLAHDLQEHRLVVCIGNPGNFATTPDAPAFRVPIEESAAGLLRVVDAMQSDESGRFLDWTGSPRAW